MTPQIEDNWYETFFSGLNCEMWERAVTGELTNNEVDFIIKVLNIESGHKILDIPCGFGRHAIELAKRGFDVTGIDISTSFVETMRQRLTAESISVKVLHGDFLTTNLQGPFDGAYCMGNSFGYVDHRGMCEFVKNVSGALKPKGRFVINSGLVAESILTHFPAGKQFILGDLTMDINNSYDMEEGFMSTVLTYTKEGIQEIQRFKHYVYTLSEIIRMLRSHGFHVIDTFKDTEMNKYALGDQQMFLVAEKNAETPHAS